MTDGLQTHPHLDSGREQNTRALDVAVGILVGLRRCSTYVSFRELLSASERHAVPIFALAGALVNLASRDPNCRPATAAAQSAAEREWGAYYPP
ncbi:transcription antitermination regulator [Mycobacterium vicinigordonae]|uniref:Transcription antitermination regulator n=1 Tax=Mycobacterium vicinigordonae TaxID=1719132 RepID=A0A7D6HYF3_9MYCO|nr:transcription antitermination regulator [Mycobacterium vicinigordonae]QLL05774.1 transcription antitermination regulator [Mycobacterium vicinigordonae]